MEVSPVVNVGQEPAHNGSVANKTVTVGVLVKEAEHERIDAEHIESSCGGQITCW